MGRLGSFVSITNAFGDWDIYIYYPYALTTTVESFFTVGIRWAMNALFGSLFKYMIKIHVSIRLSVL